MLRAERGIRALLCEGGPRVFSGLLHEGVVDELFLTVAADHPLAFKTRVERTDLQGQEVLTASAPIAPTATSPKKSHTTASPKGV